MKIFDENDQYGISLKLYLSLPLSMQLLVCAMGPPGGGRNHITGRFTRHLNVISIESFDDTAMTKIFSALADWHFSKGFDAIFGRLGKVNDIAVYINFVTNTVLRKRERGREGRERESHRTSISLAR